MIWWHSEFDMLLYLRIYSMHLCSRPCSSGCWSSIDWVRLISPHLCWITRQMNWSGSHQSTTFGTAVIYERAPSYMCLSRLHSDSLTTYSQPTTVHSIYQSYTDFGAVHVWLCDFFASVKQFIHVWGAWIFGMGWQRHENYLFIKSFIKTLNTINLKIMKFYSLISSYLLRKVLVREYVKHSLF